jgi:hypothetical protein
MNKNEIKLVVDELRKGITYPGVETDPLHGCGLSDFPIGKHVRKEVIVNMLNWQCIYLNGNIDETELDNMIDILKSKKIIMI